MAPPPRTDPPDLSASPLYPLAVLFSARRSKDRMLEGVTRRRLDALGVRVSFGDELPASDTAAARQGGNRG